LDPCSASLMPLWQSTQLSFPCTDFANGSGRTPTHSLGKPFFRDLNSASWQSMHSLFGTAGLAEMPSAGFLTASAERPPSRDSPSHRAAGATQRIPKRTAFMR
jgi:hypothetical protein